MIHKNFTYLCILTSFILAPYFSNAEQNNSTITLQEAIVRSIESSIDANHLDLQLTHRYADAFETQALENPEVEYDAAFTTGGQPSNSLQIEQPLRLSDFGSRSNYAKTLKYVGDLEKKSQLIRIINTTVILYYDYWLLQEQEGYLSNSEKEVSTVLKQVQKAAKLGELAPTDLEIFKAETLRLREELRNIRNQRIALKEELLQRLGMSWQNTLIASPPNLKPISLGEEALLKYAEHNNLTRNILTARKNAAKARLKVAQHDRLLPQIAPRFLYERNSEGDEEGVGFGLRLNIPLWNRNDAELKRARSELSFAETELTIFDKINLENIIKAKLSQALDSQTRATNYHDKILPSYEKSYSLTKKRFDTGQLSILDLWQVRERINSIQEITLEALSQSIHARLALEELIGAKLEEIQ